MRYTLTTIPVSCMMEAMEHAAQIQVARRSGHATTSLSGRSQRPPFNWKPADAIGT